MVRVVICGSGNGAHAIAGVASSQIGNDVRVLTLCSNHAEVWSKSLRSNKFSVNVDGAYILDGKPSLISKKAAVVIPGADIILITVPPFAQKQYFDVMRPLITPGMVIVGLPGKSGFEIDARFNLGVISRHCTLLNFESLPFACQISAFGKSVDIFEIKDQLIGAIQYGCTHSMLDPIGMLQQIHGALPKFSIRGHIIGISMMDYPGIMHTCMMYGKWHDYEEDQEFDDKPLSYHAINSETSNLMCRVSNEIIAISKAIMVQRPSIYLEYVNHIYRWYSRFFSENIKNSVDFHNSILSNESYDELRLPMIEKNNGKFIPNFQHRYLRDDVNDFLVPIRGIATIADVATPSIDVILSWAQRVLSKEYLVSGELIGCDIKLTRAPQRYNIDNLDEILGIFNDNGCDKSKQNY